MQYPLSNQPPMGQPPPQAPPPGPPAAGGEEPRKPGCLMPSLWMIFAAVFPAL